MKTYHNLAKFREDVGLEIGLSPWVTVTQDMINVFADATGDHQWIHLDKKKAAAKSPYKTTIAHGYLTLSLAPRLMWESFRVNSVKMAMNYGADKVRFTDPVPPGSRIRMRITLQEVQDYAPDGLRIKTLCVFEREDSEKPVCVAELITLLFEKELVL